MHGCNLAGKDKQEIANCKLQIAISKLNTALPPAQLANCKLKNRSRPAQFAICNLQFAICNFLLLFASLGCGDAASPSPEQVPNSERTLAGIDFDPASAGTIRGQVTWEGEIPSAPPFR